MKNRIIISIFALMVLGSSLHAFEVGVTVGSMSKTLDSGFHYGIAGGTGLFVPMLKFELEYYKMKEEMPLDRSNSLSLGIKFRPKFGRFAPYGIIGIGGEFDKFGLKLSKYNKFSYFGGGVHLFIKGMLSIRADIRFLNFSDSTRTRFSAGVFIHI
jgi:hypothetical protein